MELLPREGTEFMCSNSAVSVPAECKFGRHLRLISDDELKMAEGQLMQTLTKISQMEECFLGQGLHDHQGQIFAQILAIIQQARA